MRRSATRDVLKAIDGWRFSGLPVAVATVVQTWGSAPRQPGAVMAVAADGRMAGSVSGGCVENAVALEALDAIETGQPRLLRFGVRDDDALAVGLSCGGEIRVLVEPWPDDEAQSALSASLHSDEPVAVVIGLDGDMLGRRLTVTPKRAATGGSRRGGAPLQGSASHLAAVPKGAMTLGGMSHAAGNLGDEELNHAAAKAAKQALATRRCALVHLGGAELFIAVYPPRDKLVIVGGVHMAQPLSRMARAAAFHVTVVDARQALATAERFPDADRIEVGWPADVLHAIGLDESTFVAVLTHDPKLDDPALAAALNSPARYVGVLGSRRTHAARLERLRAAGIADTDLERLHAPIGLDLGALTPGEIAVSILAEVVASRRQPTI